MKGLHPLQHYHTRTDFTLAMGTYHTTVMSGTPSAPTGRACNAPCGPAPPRCVCLRRTPAPPPHAARPSLVASAFGAQHASVCPRHPLEPNRAGQHRRGLASRYPPRLRMPSPRPQQPVPGEVQRLNNARHRRHRSRFALPSSQDMPNAWRHAAPLWWPISTIEWATLLRHFN